MIIRIASPLLATIFLITGCATTSSNDSVKNVSVAKMRVAPVKVDLKQKYKNLTFYTESDLSEYLTQCLTTELAKEGKYAQNASSVLHLTVDYKRVYTGEAFGFHKVVSRPFLNYQYHIIDNQQVIQQNQEEDVTVSLGLLGNFKTVMTMDMGNTTKEAENSYLDAICYDVVEKVF